MIILQGAAKIVLSLGVSEVANQAPRETTGRN
jgi:hypothetical protein